MVIVVYRQANRVLRDRLERVIKELVQGYILHEKTVYERQNYEDYKDLTDKKFKIREEILFDNNIVCQTNYAILERDCVNIEAYYDLLIYGTYNENDIRIICDLIENVNLKANMLDKLNCEELVDGLRYKEVSYYVSKYEEYVRVVESRKKWISKRKILVKNLKKIWPEVSKLDGLTKGEDTEDSLLKNDQKILDKVSISADFVLRLSSFCKTLNIPYEDVSPSHMTTYCKRDSKEYKLWDSLEDAIYIKNHEIYGCS